MDLPTPKPRRNLPHPGLMMRPPSTHPISCSRRCFRLARYAADWTAQI